MRGFGHRLGRPAALIPAAVAAAFLLAGCGGSGSAAADASDDPGGAHVPARGLRAGRRRPGRQADDRLVPDRPAVGRAADELQARRRPAHRRAPDHRPRRPRRDRPPPPADRAPTDGSAESITFPTPGRYRVVVDAYPNTTGPQRNFQLFRRITVAGKHRPSRCRRSPASETVDGYRFTIAGKPPPEGASRPAFMNVSRHRPEREAGPLHARGSARSRTRSSSARARSTTSTRTSARPARAAARARSAARRSPARRTTPGKLRVGVLVPTPGTWRLFLQSKVDGKVLTAPFTLKVVPG